MAKGKEENNNDDCSANNKIPIIVLKDLENVPEMVREVREFVLNEYAKNKDEYDPEDIERIKNDDWTVERFVRRRKTVKESAEMLNNTLKWRHEIAMPRLKDTDFPIEFFKIGAAFCYADDKNGNGVVYLRIRFHRKIKDLEREIKQFIMFHINQMDLKTNGHGMAIVFDCKGAGLSNLDMDMIWFLVQSLLNYYPHGMAYILVYELPWVLQSAWTVVKNWLPTETREKIKFANKDEILQYFDKENLPAYMGGTCEIDYHQIPKGCKPARVIAEQREMSEKAVNRIMKTFQPFLDEAEEEMKQLATC